MVAFYSNKAAVPPCPCSQASDDFEIENPSGDRQTSSSSIDLEPMLQDLPGELEGQTCCKDDVLLQLRDRHQWQVEHMSQRPVMYNIVIIKGMHPQPLMVATRDVCQSTYSFCTLRTLRRNSTSLSRIGSHKREGRYSTCKGSVAEGSTRIHQTRWRQPTGGECLGKLVFLSHTRCR